MESICSRRNLAPLYVHITTETLAVSLKLLGIGMLVAVDTLAKVNISFKKPAMWWQNLYVLQRNTLAAACSSLDYLRK